MLIAKKYALLKNNVEYEIGSYLTVNSCLIPNCTVLAWLNVNTFPHN